MPLKLSRLISIFELCLRVTISRLFVADERLERLLRFVITGSEPCSANHFPGARKTRPLEGRCHY